MLDSSPNWLGIFAILSQAALWAVAFWHRLEEKYTEARFKGLERALDSKLDHAAVVAIAREFARDLKSDSDNKHATNIERLKETNDRTKRIEDILLGRPGVGK